MIREITVAMLHALSPYIEPERTEEMVQVASQVAHNRHEVALIVAMAASDNGLLAGRYPFWRMELLPLARTVVSEITVGAVRACGPSSSLSVRFGWYDRRTCTEDRVSRRSAALVRWLENLDMPLVAILDDAQRGPS